MYQVVFTRPFSKGKNKLGGEENLTTGYIDLMYYSDVKPIVKDGSVELIDKNSKKNVILVGIVTIHEITEEQYKEILKQQEDMFRQANNLDTNIINPSN